jgi:hypothetical protein
VGEGTAAVGDFEDFALSRLSPSKKSERGNLSRMAAHSFA